MPHIYCLREASIIGLHLLSDAVIAVSYALIPLALVLLMRRRKDLVFPWMFTLFGLFILGCGLTHVFEIVTLWYPVYRLEGVVKGITAIASLPTALLLFRLLPRVEALPSPSQLRAEVERRLAAEVELRILNLELERRVTERTAQLAESESRFRTLAEAVPNLLWTTDGKGETTYVSARYEEFTGLPAADLLKDAWTCLLHPTDRERVKALWNDAVSTGHAYETEFRLRRFDGSYCWFVARGLPVRDTQGRITQWLGSLTDVHTLKRTEAALRHSNDQLRQFTYAAAHDLQEPLRNVSNAVGLLKRFHSSDLRPAAHEWIDGAIEGAQRMYSMVKDLLVYSRALQDTEQEQAIATVSMNDVVSAAIANLGDVVVTTGTRLEVAPLPAVRVRDVHLLQIFQNLLANAIKYRKEADAPVIRITACRTATEWCVSVIDNGIGFNPEYSEKIFGVFKRLHSRTAYSGNGIGLALCAHIVSHYGGRIWAKSESNRGAEFQFTLPVELGG